MEADRRGRRSRELHRAIAAKLRENPEEVLAAARTQLARWCENPRTRYYAEEWARWLDRPVAEISGLLADDDSDYADSMRHTAPFAGGLTPAERWEIYQRYALEGGDRE